MAQGPYVAIDNTLPPPSPDKRVTAKAAVADPNPKHYTAEKGHYFPGNAAIGSPDIVSVDYAANKGKATAHLTYVIDIPNKTIVVSSTFGGKEKIVQGTLCDIAPEGSTTDLAIKDLSEFDQHGKKLDPVAEHAFFIEHGEIAIKEVMDGYRHAGNVAPLGPDGNGNPSQPTALPYTDVIRVPGSPDVVVVLDAKLNKGLSPSSAVLRFYPDPDHHDGRYAVDMGLADDTPSINGQQHTRVFGVRLVKNGQISIADVDGNPIPSIPGKANDEQIARIDSLLKEGYRQAPRVGLIQKSLLWFNEPTTSGAAIPVNVNDGRHSSFHP